MKGNSMQSVTRILKPVLAGMIAATLCLATSARANVFASNIQLNGSLTNSVSSPAGSAVTITYILNEAATAGVTINISSNNAIVRTITIASGPGTTKGLNTVQWDGKDGGGNVVAQGTYNVSITASATGFSDWTITSDNTSTNTYSYRPYGIAAVKDTNSPYYGRIFVSVATTKAASSVVGDTQGILMYNADQTRAGVGFSRFDYTWVDDGGDSPLFVRALEDGRLHFNDWTGKGKNVSVDYNLTSSYVVWSIANYTN
jgi:hypothetical protein